MTQPVAHHIQSHQSGMRGFSAQNIWRMRQFYDAYRDEPKLSTVLRELPWSSNLTILSRAKRSEERKFYLRMATKYRWPVRELERPLVSPLVTQLPWIHNLIILSQSMGKGEQE